MKIFFCDLCNESVPQGDLDEGRASLRKGRVICATCDRLMSAQEAQGGFGASSAGGGTATLTAPAPASTSAATLAVPRDLGRPDPAPRTSSTGVWLALVTLIFSAAAFALLVERITGLETQTLQEDRALAGDVRGLTRELEAAVADVGEQSGELELRFAGGLNDARRAAEERVAELSAQLSDARVEIARSNEVVERLRGELAEERADAVRRHDDLTGRLARAEEDLRYYAQRLADLEMASLRPVTSGLSPAATEAAGAPAWQGLLADLASPLAGTRWQAVDALGEVDDPAVIEHLIPVLRDPDVFVRMAGARALEKRGAMDAVPALIDALEDPEAAVREAAFVALNSLTGRDFRFDPLAGDSDRAKRVKAWRDWWEKEGSSGS